MIFHVFHHLSQIPKKHTESTITSWTKNQKTLDDFSFLIVSFLIGMNLGFHIVFVGRTVLRRPRKTVKDEMEHATERSVKTLCDPQRLSKN